MSLAKEVRARLEELIEAYDNRIEVLERQLAAKADAAPDGYEWQPVDEEHPLTAEDHRRMVRQRNGEAWMMAWNGGGQTYQVKLPWVQCTATGKLWAGDPKQSPHDIIAVLRPKPAPKPPKPQPGEVWESVTAEITGCGIMRGEIVNTSNGMVYLLDAQGDGQHLVGFAIEGDRLRCRFWNDRKLTRRVS